MPDAISQTHLDDDNPIANGFEGDQEAFNVRNDLTGVLVATGL
jgi:hypothetical protein